MIEQKCFWTDAAARVLLGRTIVRVEYMSPDDRDANYWTHRGLVIYLDDGTQVSAMVDEEGNDAGAFWTTHPDHGILPRL